MPGQGWTKEQKSIIQRLFPSANNTRADILTAVNAAGPERSWDAIVHHASRVLGLKREWRHAWERDWESPLVKPRRLNVEWTWPQKSGWHERRILFVPDIHFPWQEGACLWILRRIIEDWQPHGVCVMGDLLDAYHLSGFGKDPDWEATLDDELSQARGFLSWIKRTVPDAKVIYCEGNHEQRWDKFLANDGRAIASLHDKHGVQYMSVPALLGLQERGIIYLQYNRDWLTVFGVRVIHGKRYNLNAAKQNIDWYHRSGVSGHSHRLETRHKTVEGKVLTWIQGGCLCSGWPEYVESPDWQHGFAVATLREGYEEMGPFLQEVPINQGVAWFGGEVYDGRKVATMLDMPLERVIV